jgi:hypothetical protein
MWANRVGSAQGVRGHSTRTMTSQPSALGVAYAHTVAFSGIDVKPIDVQVQISAGLPAFTIVGLPDKAVGESRERVRSALGALGIGLPTRRITVTWRRRTCSRRAATSTCRSRWRCWSRLARYRRIRPGAIWRLANWRSMARSAR